MSAYVNGYETVAHDIASMGGRLQIAITTRPERRVDAEKAARRVADRVEAWAARLTRFSDASDLSALNASRAERTSVRPTLAAVLRWARDAERRSDGVVAPTMLDQRLAAENGSAADEPAATSWRIVDEPASRQAVVDRSTQFRFDLDGLAKGWLADRAADLLSGWPGVCVDADGDIAFHADSDVDWLVAVDDPRTDGDDAPPLVTLHLHGGEAWRSAYGVATSGTSVHRWHYADGRAAHHLIDPATGRPADTDVVQATVIAPTAREAEMIAKSAVILGARRGYEFLDHSAALAAVLLLDCGDLVALPGIDRWLA